MITLTVHLKDGAKQEVTAADQEWAEAIKEWIRAKGVGTAEGKTYGPDQIEGISQDEPTTSEVLCPAMP